MSIRVEQKQEVGAVRLMELGSHAIEAMFSLWLGVGVEKLKHVWDNPTDWSLK